jgi:hypothetical protein
VLSDALESIINVVAATFMVGSVVFAGRPQTAITHTATARSSSSAPSSRGGLISFAAITIAWYAVMDLLRGPSVQQVEVGLLITLACGIGNAALGRYLLRTGRREQSPQPDRRWQPRAVRFLDQRGRGYRACCSVRFTGLAWLDPMTAIVVAVNLAITGARLVRQCSRRAPRRERTPSCWRSSSAPSRAARPGADPHPQPARHPRRTASRTSECAPDPAEYWTVEAGASRGRFLRAARAGLVLGRR